MRLAEKTGRVSFNLRARERVRLTFAFSFPQDHKVRFAWATGFKHSRDLESSLRRFILYEIDRHSANRKVNRIQRTGLEFSHKRIIPTLLLYFCS